MSDETTTDGTTTDPPEADDRGPDTLPDPSQMTERVRAEVVRLAHHFERADVDTSPELCDLIAPPDLEPPQMRADMLRAWTCGNFARGVYRAALRACGVILPAELAEPYREQHALSDLYAFGSRAGALRSVRYGAGGPTRPRDGDVFHVVSPEHVGIVVARLPLSDATNGAPRILLQTVEGGQEAKNGAQAVRARSWTSQLDRGAWTVGPRRIDWWIDLDALVRHLVDFMTHGG